MLKPIAAATTRRPTTRRMSFGFHSNMCRSSETTRTPDETFRLLKIESVR
jgi:hypothetical protein